MLPKRLREGCGGDRYDHGISQTLSLLTTLQIQVLEANKILCCRVWEGMKQESHKNNKTKTKWKQEPHIHFTAQTSTGPLSTSRFEEIPINAPAWLYTWHHEAADEPCEAVGEAAPLFSELVPQVGENGRALGHYNMAAAWWASWESLAVKSSQLWGFESDGRWDTHRSDTHYWGARPTSIKQEFSLCSSSFLNTTQGGLSSNITAH